jgi:hypothetical protein
MGRALTYRAWWIIALLLILIGASSICFLFLRAEKAGVLDVSELIDLEAVRATEDGPLRLGLSKGRSLEFDTVVQDNQVLVPAGDYDRIDLRTWNNTVQIRGRFSIEDGKALPLPALAASVDYRYEDNGDLFVAMNFAPADPDCGWVEFAYAIITLSRGNLFSVSDANGRVVWKQTLPQLQHQEIHDGNPAWVNTSPYMAHQVFGRYRLSWSGPMPDDIVTAARGERLYIAPTLEGSFVRVSCKKTAFKISVPATREIPDG